LAVDRRGWGRRPLNRLDELPIPRHQPARVHRRPAEKFSTGRAARSTTGPGGVEMPTLRLSVIHTRAWH
jgi:hypothetical protein